MTDQPYIMPDNMRAVLGIALTLHNTHGAIWFDPWAFTSLTLLSWKEINHWVDELILGGFLDWRGKGEHAPDRGTRITQAGIDYLAGIKEG